MLTLHDNKLIADQQVIGLIYCLTAFGYIDGEYDDDERAFVADYIDRIVRSQAEGVFDSSEREWERERRIRDQVAHFERIREQIDEQMAEASSEIVAAGESQLDYIVSRLELETYKIFKQFGPDDQQALFDTVDELLHADGIAHPNELRFREELRQLLEIEVEPYAATDTSALPVTIADLAELDSGHRNHPLFAALEREFPPSPAALAQALDADVALIHEVRRLHGTHRAKGKGKLASAQTVTDFAGDEKFLDEFIWVMPPKPDESWEITVLGDLHGCYSCLKAAVIQSRFFERVEAYERDPANAPRPAMVLLGDYVDRGLFSFQGVLRGAMELFKAAPDHVFMLRGNHEMLFDMDGEILPAVRPAEALNDLKEHSSYEQQLAIKTFFDDLPAALIFDQLLFVHGGAPKDKTMRENFTGLASLNDPQVRMDMMWGDPSDTEVVPEELQQKAVRFSFGRRQCRTFLERIGCHTIIRGHEKLNEGYDVTYREDDQVVVTVFSSGGSSNDDLPPTSSYRKVEPKALTVRYLNGETEIEPWSIHYAPYVTPELNGFYANS